MRAARLARNSWEHHKSTKRSMQKLIEIVRWESAWKRALKLFALRPFWESQKASWRPKTFCLRLSGWQSSNLRVWKPGCTICFCGEATAWAIPKINKHTIQQSHVKRHNRILDFYACCQSRMYGWDWPFSLSIIMVAKPWSIQRAKSTKVGTQMISYSWS